MQRTRLNTIVTVTGDRFNRWISNPWRRFSLQVILFLGGFFGASVVSLTSGQTANSDVLMSLLSLAGVELTNWLYYRSLPPSQAPRPLGLELLNAGKLGFVHGLFLDAFKLGS